MDIDKAISTLSKFKQISKKMGNECELVGFNDSAFTFTVKFSNVEEDKPKHIIGFSVGDVE